MKKDDLLRIEQATLMEEFKTARDNMLFDVGQSRQVVNITLTAASILVVGVPFIIQYNLPILFLIAPLIFYPLAWSQVRYLYLSDILGQYLLTVLIPRVHSVLKELSPSKDRNFDSILSWEAYLGTADRRYSLVLLPVAGGNYGINLLAAAFSIGAYFAVTQTKGFPLPAIDLVFIILNAILFAYSVGLGFWSRFSLDVSNMSKELSQKRSISK